MANLSDAINEIIGTPTTEDKGLRWFSNWSTTETAGEDAPNALSIKRKLEADPVLFLSDLTDDVPAVYFQIMGMFPSTQVRGKHYECQFRIRAYILGILDAGERPFECGRRDAIYLTENIMASDRLGLDWIDSIQWEGCDYENDIVKYLHLDLPEIYVGATRFLVKASGLTF